MELVSLDLSNDDTDYDTMPDWWEQSQFSNLTEAGRETDSDGDGVLDRYEYPSGTNPRDPRSVLKMLSAVRVSSRNISVRWSGVAGQVYTLERSTNLLRSWEQIEKGTVGETLLQFACSIRPMQQIVIPEKKE